MEGFPISDYRGQAAFGVKELAVCYMDEDQHVENWHFRVEQRLDELNYVNRKQVLKTASFLTRHIHGMEFKDLPEHLPPEFLPSIILRIYETCFRKFGRVLIAYKGGEIERKLLNALYIPNINLEVWDCPKYNDLVSVYSPPDMLNCGLHTHFSHTVILPHCPKQETFVFKMWLKLVIERFNKKELIYLFCLYSSHVSTKGTIAG